PSDPPLARCLRKTYQGEIPLPKKTLDLTVSGSVGKPLRIEANGVRVNSAMPLQTAFKRPLTEKTLREQLGRLGETNFVLGEVHNRLVGHAILPISELNRLRRELVSKLSNGSQARSSSKSSAKPVLSDLVARLPQEVSAPRRPELVVLRR